MTTQHEIPVDTDPPQNVKDNIEFFLVDLVALCNKHRLWVVLQAIGYLHSDVIEGKLLDVSGFYYDKESKNILPFYVDRMSEE